MPTSSEAAEIVALKCLAWLAGNDDLLPDFHKQTGASGDDFTSRAQDPEFLLCVLDFVLADDARVIEFSESAGLAPESLMAARQGLPGGGDVHWT